MKSNSVISALCWVSRGYAAPIMKQYEPDDAEILEHSKLSKKYLKKDIKTTELKEAANDMEENLDNMQMDFEDAKNALNNAEKVKQNQEMIDADTLGGNMPIFSSELDKMKEAVIADDDGDEDFISDEGMPEAYSDSDEEKEDYTIRKSDNLIITATAEDDHSNLEVYLFDHKTSDLYVHHEIILGAYPICLEWLN